MSKSKHTIVKRDPNGDLHFEDGFSLPWSEVWEEAIRRSHWRQRGGGVASKIRNVIYDKHNLWKVEYPRGLDGGKAPSSDLSSGCWRDWYNKRKALGLVPDINEYEGVNNGKEYPIPNECIRCLNLLECCEGETAEARKLFKKRVALFKKISFCEDYVPDLSYINRGY